MYKQENGMLSCMYIRQIISLIPRCLCRLKVKVWVKLGVYMDVLNQSNSIQCTCTLRSCYDQFTGLTRELPLNVHLLTLQFLGANKYLIRLEHQFEMDEVPWNEPATLSLSVSVTEITLSFFAHVVGARLLLVRPPPFSLSLSSLTHTC